MRICRRTISLLLVVFVLLIVTRPCVADDPTKEARLAIDGAENSLSNLWSDLRDYWLNVSDEVRRLSFADGHEAFRSINAAKSELQRNQFDMALEFGYSGWFLASRASYRIYLNMTEGHILLAQKVIDSIPPYIAKPPEALELLKKAKSKWQDLYNPFVFEVSWPGLQNAKQYVHSFSERSHNLYWEKDSPAKLADQARDMAIRHLSSSIVVARSELASALSEIRVDFMILVLVQFGVIMLCLVPVLHFVKTKLVGWARSIRVSWSGSVFQEQLLGRWLPIAPAPMAFAGGYLYRLILKLGQVVNKYQLAISYDGLLGAIVIVSILCAIVSLALVLANHYGKKPRLTGFASIVLLFGAILAQICAVSMFWIETKG